MKRLAMCLLVMVLGVTVVGSSYGQLTRVCIIDEDMIDNSSPAILELASQGLCGGGDPQVCVNDQLANPGVRLVLPLPVGTILG